MNEAYCQYWGGGQQRRHLLSVVTSANIIELCIFTLLTPLLYSSVNIYTLPIIIIKSAVYALRYSITK